jgi:hypothetical protein
MKSIESSFSLFYFFLSASEYFFFFHFFPMKLKAKRSLESKLDGAARACVSSISLRECAPRFGFTHQLGAALS